MKKIVFILMLIILNSVLSAQEITLTFQSEDKDRKIDSIWVTNLDTNDKVKLFASDTLRLTSVTAINSFQNPATILYPNPCRGATKLFLNTKSKEHLQIRVSSMTGQTVSLYTEPVDPGGSVFNITFPGSGIFIVSAQTSSGTICRKVVCQESIRREASIEFEGTKNEKMLKQGLAVKSIGYTPGNIIHYLMHAENSKTVFTDSPKKKKKYDVQFYDCLTADSKSYKTVKMGNHIWMAENLAFLPVVNEWKDGSNNDPRYYVEGYYSGTDVNIAKEKIGYRLHGVLYNLPAALKSCPEGWHLPSDLEWDNLSQFVSDQKGPFEKTAVYWYEVGKYLKARDEWSTNANGSDAFGFCILPGGQRTSSGTPITGQFGNFWTSTAYFGSTTYYWFVGGPNWIKRTNGMNDQGFSVRCIKNDK